MRDGRGVGVRGEHAPPWCIHDARGGEVTARAKVRSLVAHGRYFAISGWAHDVYCVLMCRRRQSLVVRDESEQARSQIKRHCHV